MPADTLPAKLRRAALQVLSRDRLQEIADRFDLAVEDRRSRDAHVDAIVRSRSLEFGNVLRAAKRDELKEMCRALGLDDSGREIDVLVERILAMPAAGGADGEGAPAKAAAGFELTAPAARARRSRAPAADPAPKGGEPFGDYRHDDTRRNNPPAGLIDLEKPPPKPTRTYAYDPHLDPRLEWAGKAEHGSFEVDTVSLHIHERISAQAIVRAVKKEDAQRSLFAQPELDPSKEVDFYAHEVGWANRLVLGDSLLVMNSLLEREQLAGKVQCIYVDPPYGVKFNSNFQPSISRRDVKDGDDASLTREPEQIQAYRDTWQLGIHSYLTYLRDRLLLARELLAESGSIFVQISDENVHHVRELMDEVFGAENFLCTIAFKKTGLLDANRLSVTTDYLLWYSRNVDKVKYRKLFRPREVEDSAAFRYVLMPDGTPTTLAELGIEPSALPPGARLFQSVSLTSQGQSANTSVPFAFKGKKFHPPPGRHWSVVTDELARVAAANRIMVVGESLRFMYLLNDYPVAPVTNVWSDTGTGSFTEAQRYVVETAQKVIARCLLMTTDPGDLVLDPTCGSGTTAYVAEQWGRRWITCDTSRVALSLARQRLLTARFPFYRLKSDRVKDGFHYKTVPHITLKSIAQNAKLDGCTTQEERERVIRDSAEQETLYDQPLEDKGKVRVSGPFTVEAIPVAAMEHDEAQPLDPNARQDDLARPGRGADVGRVADDGGDYVGHMIDLLKRSGGVHFKNGKSLAIPTLRPVRTPHEWLHAESETGIEGDPRKVAVSFGPRHGPVTPKQVLDGIQQTRDYDIVLFVGFACDPEAGRMIEMGASRRELHFVHAAPDILVTDLLKTSKATKLFTVFGLPDVKVKKEKDGEVTVTLTGIDVYDPTTGETRHDGGENVAAWFLDHDYDGRTFLVCQAFFPAGKTKNPWEKLQKALKGSIDEERFEALRGTTSIPFKPGKRIAVKVIDDRGNEVVKVVAV